MGARTRGAGPDPAPGSRQRLAARPVLAVALGLLCLAGAAWGTRGVLRIVGSARGDWPAILVLMVAVCAALAPVLLLAGWLELRRARPGMGFDAPGPLLRKAFVAVVLAWLWTVFVQQELYWGPILPLSAALAALLFAAALAAVHLPDRLFPTGLRRGLDLALFSLCAAAVASEAGLRAWSHASPSPLLARHDASPEQRLQFYRLRPGQLRFGLRVNSSGYFDEEFSPHRSKPRRVVVIGDSFSIGLVPHPLHYTSVAEEALGDSELCNLGIASIGPAQYLQLLRTEAIALAPDLVVICLFAGNDLKVGPITIQREGLWRRLLFDRKNVLLYLVPRRLQLLAQERARGGRGGAAVGAVQGDDLRIPEGAPLGRILESMPWIEEPELEQPTWSPEQYLTMEAARVRLACSDGSGAYEELFAVLEQIVDQAGSVRLAFMLIPDEFQIEDDLWREALAAAGGGALERDLFQRRVGAWLEARGIPTLDLLPHLRAVAPRPDGRLHLYALRDSHFNARGNRVAGLALADFLRPLLEPTAERR